MRRRDCVRPSAWAASISTALLACLGCASPHVRSREPARPGSHAPREARPLHDGAPPTSVPVTVVTGQEAIGVDELLTRARRRLDLRRAREAARDFDRVVSHDASGPWSVAALLGGGEAWEALGDFEQAAQHFEQLARRFPLALSANQARLRSVRLRLHQGRFLLAAHSAAQLLSTEPRLRPALRALAVAALALAELEGGEREQARRRLALTRAELERLGALRLGRIPTDLATFYFALGESHRSEAEQLPILHRPEGFADRLEARCQAILHAQAGYEGAMRAFDSHWSSLAGYRLGQLYERLYEELVRVPPPDHATPSQGHLFRAALRVRYAVLVRKATALLTHTLALARRASVDSPWRQEAELSLERLLAAQRALESDLAAAPYSAADLESALLRLQGPT